MPAAPPSSESAASCHADERSAAASKAGPHSSGAARRRLRAIVARLVAQASWEDGSDTEAPRSSDSAMGGTTRRMPRAVRAIASAPVRSVFAVPGNMSRACPVVLPGTWPTSTPLARQRLTTSEPTLFFWSTTTSAPSPASSSRASTSETRLSTLRPAAILPEGSSPIAQWNDLPTSMPR